MARAVVAAESLLLRRLEVGDYRKGFLELLGQLTVVGDVTETMFKGAIINKQEQY